MATDVGPCTGEVVCHEVEKVEQLAYSRQVKLLETVFAHREGTGQEVIRCRESLSNGLKEQEIILSCLRSLRMFPVNCSNMLASLLALHFRAHSLSTPSS